MKRFKQAVASVLAAAMILSLAACGGKTTSTKTTKAPEQTTASAVETTAGTEAAESTGQKEWFGTEDGQTITLHLWAGVQPEYGYDELCQNFNEEYKDKGLQVEYTRYVNNAEGNLQLETYLMSGDQDIDLIISYGSYETRVEAGFYQDLTDMLKEHNFDLDEAIGKTAASWRVIDGHIYGIPTITNNPFWMMINVDMFKEAGVEIPYDGWTYDEFLDALAKLTHGEGQDKVYGIYWGLNGGSIPRYIMSSPLGEFWTYANTDGTEVSFGDPLYKQGLDMIKTCIDNDYCIPLADEVAEKLNVGNTFLQGKCAISVNVPHIRLVMDQKNYPHDFVTALVPGPVPSEEYMTDEYKFHNKVVGPSDTISIASTCKNPEAAFEFLHWYITGGQAPLIKYGRLPLYTGFKTDDLVNELVASSNGMLDERSLKSYVSVDRSHAVLAIRSWAVSEIDTVWKEEFEAFCYGKQTEDETIDHLVTRSNKLIADAIEASKK